MKCLVTGAAGFIGSHLCERLIKDGHHVVGIDDLSSGSAVNISGINRSTFEFVNANINALPLTYNLGGCDWIFHLAAKADIVPSIERPWEYHETNVTGTVKMLELARRVNAKRFIYAASSSCYGIPQRYPTRETSQIKPMYPYALTKYIGEQYVLHWAKIYKLPIVSLRLFNVYGPRSRTSGSYGAVFGVFLSQLANGKPITIVGTGEQTRDFTYVSDVVDAFVKAAESRKSFKRHPVFNIGSGKPQSVNKLADILGAKSRVYLPDRPGEPKMTCADASYAKGILGWEPKVKFEVGAAVMKGFVQDYKNAPLWSPETIAKATESWFRHLGAN